jgi:hypothetical protein
MTIYLKQSTASQEVPLGYFVDSTDGNTEKTALTIANTDIKVWKTGATTLASKNSGGGTHISNGIYYAVLDATDTDTLGPLVLFAHLTGALPVRLECVVLAANVYDSLIGGGAVLSVNATQFAGTAYATAQAAEVTATWNEQVDGTVTARQSMRLANSANGGKVSGGGTTTVVIRDLADTKDRVSATVDANGNRSAVTRDLT